MNRLYSFESGMSLTGSNADHRAAVRSVDVPALIAKLEKLVAAELESHQPQGARQSDGIKTDRMLAALADDLVRHRGGSLVTTGEHQPAEVHARIHRLNDLLGNVGTTISYTIDPIAEHGGVGAVVGPDRPNGIGSRENPAGAGKQSGVRPV
jgi:hypothetical protein